MKNELRLFENVEFGQVRVTKVNGKEYFIGIDIAKSIRL